MTLVIIGRSRKPVRARACKVQSQESPVESWNDRTTEVVPADGGRLVTPGSECVNPGSAKIF